MSAPKVITIRDKLAGIDDHWNPRIVARYNGNEVRLVKALGEFTWHSHPDTDELFMVISGCLRIEFRDAERSFGPGEFIVIPKGVEHRPVADEECHILFFDREGESNTGDSPSHRTRAGLEWI